ncbi:MAG: hypothetical protein QW797_08160 [Thermoproteota archaeon]
MSLRTLACLNCNAAITAPQGASIVVCPYCGHAFEVSTGKKLEYYMFPSCVDSPSAWRKVMNFILRKYGVPDDFNAKANLLRAELYYIPYHVFRCKAYFSHSYQGRYMSYLKLKNMSILAARTGTWLDRFAKKLSFSVRGKSFFNPNQAQKSSLYLPGVSYKEAYKTAYNSIRERARAAAMFSSGSVEKVEVEYLGLVHYPFRLMNYTYKEKTYRVLLDASKNSVLFIEYPRPPVERRTMLNVIKLIIAVGLISGLISGLFATIWSPLILIPFSLMNSLMTSIIFSLPFLRALKDKVSESPAQVSWSIERL